MKGNEKTEVLIIGAGASAAAFAWKLSRHNFKVTVLEQGHWPDRQKYPQNRKDWESHFRGSMNMNPNVRKNPSDYPVNSENSDISPLMYNAVGGSTIVWGAHFPRFHPSDFEDWPFTYEDLEKYFDINDTMMGVSGLAGDPAYPPKPQRPMPPLPLGIFGETLAEGFKKLGWHWWPVDAAINSEPYKGRAPCNYGGSCVLGCRRGARSSPDISYWPYAVKQRVTIKTGCRVSRIVTDNTGKAAGAEFYDEKGSLQFIEADMVVAAANGVGTPRLLLMSADGRNPDGLANSSGMVGRNIMVHPAAFVTGVFPENLESWKGPVGNSLYSHEFYETDESRGFIKGIQLQAQRQYGGVDTALGGVTGVRIPWGVHHHKEFAARMGHQAMMLVLADDIPEYHNRVILDETMTDSSGLPSPRILYKYSENTEKMLDFGVKKATEVMKAAGASEILANARVREVFHLMGTARMGTDPQQSVVNEWGQSHDISNLYIIDGSVFISGGAANPTSTIQAVALRMADHICNNRKEALK